MKNLKYYFMALLCAVLTVGAVSCSDDDDKKQELTVNSLPEAARTFVTQYFGTDQVTSVKYDPKSVDETYVVSFQSGAKADFDANGQWTEVDAGRGLTIPDGILLDSIVEYVQLNYNGQGVTEVERSATGYKVDLANGIDLYFDPSGGFLRAEN